MRITEVHLSEKQRVELEYTVVFDSRPFMRKRCQYVLLKAKGSSSKSMAKELSTTELTINRWVNRYLADGMEGLRNKPGQGAKRIMDSSDTEKVIETIQKDRLSVMKAKERWQQATLFPPAQHCRDTVENTQGQMDPACRLLFGGYVVLCC